MKHSTWIVGAAPPTAAKFNAIVGLVSLGIALAGCGGPGQPGAGDGGRAGSGGAGGPIPPTLSLFAGGIGGPGNADGTGAAARFSGFQDSLTASPQGLATDGAGNLFVADTRNGAIRKIVIATGAVTTLARTTGFDNAQGLATDGAGNLFVADTLNSIILKVVIATGAVTTLAGATFFYPRGLACDNAGNLFVAEPGAIRKVVIATGSVTTLAGTPGVYGREDGTGPAATFNFASAMARDNAGNLFVADSPAIRKVVIATGVVTTLAEILEYPYDASGISTSTLSVGLSSDGLGNLFVAVAASHMIRKVVIATGVVTTIAGSLGGSGTTDGTGTAARFDILGGLANDGAGNLFVADNTTIRKIVLATGLVTTLAGSSRVLGSADGTGTAARFDWPTGLLNDGAGSLFVADSRNHTIRQVDISTGAVTTLVGTPGIPGLEDGTGAAARLDFPVGLASDGAGNLFVSDRKIRKVVVATGDVTTIEGIPDVARSAMAADGAGNLFIAGWFNHTIRKVDVATGLVTTIAGSPGVSGSTDGMGAAARFNGPSGLATDGAGNLFVADGDNHTIRRVDVATGLVTTIAGSPGVSGSADGTGTTARFYWPGLLATDGAGNLFVADTGNSTIRKIVVATGVVTTPVGSPGHGGVALGPLPAGLTNPVGLAVGPAGSLFITDENAILQVR